MKTYVIIVSQKFPKKHPRFGEQTNFVQSIKEKSKIHTVRLNVALWKERIRQVCLLNKLQCQNT